MLTHVHARTAAIALLATCGVLAVAGCGASGSDKAGGSQQRNALVLTLANINGGSTELEPFAASVAQLSGGSLRIEFKNDWRQGSVSNETDLIADIKAGKADIGWAGSRAFDSVGVKSFDALHAPLLVTSYPLEEKVLESPLVTTMLDGLKPLDVVGIGILPGPMRKPLGVLPLVRPQDYQGRTLAYSRSLVAQQTLQALGATGTEIPAAGGISGYDGVESQIAAIEGNSYDSVATFLTANVNLWPRPQVLFMNKRAFDSLTNDQRTALHRAVTAALQATVAVEQADQKNAVANLCRRGLTFVAASDADLVALRTAVEPVYAHLNGDAPTKSAIDAIVAISHQNAAAATPDAATCSGAGLVSATPGPVTPIDGLYTLHTTADEMRAAGAPNDEIIPENYGDFEWVLNGGLFTQAQPQGDKGAGTYTVVGDTLTVTFTQGSGGPAHNRPGETFTYRWSLYRDQLTLTRVSGAVSPFEWSVKPWRRVGSAP